MSDCHANVPASVPATERASGGGRVTAVVVGNPNVGKTTLFNALTGHNARVGNYPGVTVERRSAELDLAEDSAPLTVELIDVPGTYSLSARSAEEQIAISAVLGLEGNPKPDLVVVVMDAGQLVRNLYLVLQLVELEVNVVAALNMMDEVQENPPSAEAIERLLGVPCVPIVARSAAGLAQLKRAMTSAIHLPRAGSLSVPYPPALRPHVDAVAESLPVAWRSSVERDRAMARWALLSIDEDDELTGIEAQLRRACTEARSRAQERDIDQDIIGARYAYLDRHAPALYAVRQSESTPRSSFSDSVDRVLIHPVYGFAIFVALMLILFQSLFAWADPAIALAEAGIGTLQDATVQAFPPGLVRDLITDGILGGVGNVIVFLPQILLLFLFIGLLEDSGYMARVAYLMDRVMRSLGLHGRAFVPMLSGFACAIPAILATRTMERRRDRLLTMMVIPLMTCSARLPVYTLIIAALFPPTLVFGWFPVQGFLLVAMYFFSIAVTLLSAAVLGRTAIRGRRVPLILELPPYRRPKLSGTLRMMWERSRVFLTEAGTVILACTIALWVLLSFPRLDDETGSSSPEARAQHQLEQSYGGRLGHAIEPALEPLGFDWKIGVGIIGAFAAREVFVSTMGVVYGVGASDEETAPLRERMRKEARADGTPAYTPLAGLSLMVFFALACQCMSTLAVVRRETRSWRWPVLLFTYMTALAWFASFIVYQGGRLLGFG